MPTLRDSPTSMLMDGRSTPQPPFVGSSTTQHITDEQTIDPKDEEERNSLINEIRRLEQSMNGALRTSRDEMEKLSQISQEKRELIERMQEEHDDIMKQIENDGIVLSAESAGSQQAQQRRSSDGSTKGGGGGGPDLRKSLRKQNSMFRRLSVSGDGDRPFFRRPALKDDDAEMRESIRRKSDPAAIDGALLFGNCDDSYQSSDAGGGSRTSKPLQRRVSEVDFESEVDSDVGSDSQNGSNHDRDHSTKDGSKQGEDMTEDEARLESKKKQIEDLQYQKLSNENQLSYLESKLQSIHTQSRTRYGEHAMTVERLSSRQQTLTKNVKQRQSLVAEVEGCLEEYEERIEKLEQEIEDKMSLMGDRVGMVAATSDCDGNSIHSASKSETEKEIQKYQLRLKIHSQYTATALESFLNCMVMAKKHDTNGVLLSSSSDKKETDGNEEINWEDNDGEDERQRLIEEIALDVDIQLNNLERMIKDVGEKVEEFQLLSSFDYMSEEVPAQDGGIENTEAPEQDVGENFIGIVNEEDPSRNHPNQLLSLSKECADLLADFVSTISKTMESTTRTTPHSFSIEFQQASSPGEEAKEETTDTVTPTSNTARSNRVSQHDFGRLPIASGVSNHNDEEELPYFQIQRKKLHLHELQRSQLQVNTNISLLQNDIQAFQAALEQEKQAQYDMMSNLQDKLRMLMERMEDGGMEMQGLISELERLELMKEKGEMLLQQINHGHL